ncbi:hypothetical protein TorRG33x02_351420 [Trema orientale]|uniref:Secreted protein n=1 Tax=Trema orientale TaxID=63057 RepID=A0A2P5AFT2_TREOI|nr:hypothetical protein TorRG33x02_351420 [Trema orientale]
METAMVSTAATTLLTKLWYTWAVLGRKTQPGTGGFNDTMTSLDRTPAIRSDSEGGIFLAGGWSRTTWQSLWSRNKQNWNVKISESVGGHLILKKRLVL